MSTDELLRDALDAGLEFRLDGAVIRIAGDADAVEAWAPRLRPHKAELIERLRESSRLTHELLMAAMRACDAHGDGPAAREQMRRDCLATPPELRADLLGNLQRTYGAKP